MNIAIKNLTVIEEEYLKDFIFKEELSEVELCGLEWILSELIFDRLEEIGEGYCLNLIKKNCLKLVNDCTVYKKDRLSILNGETDMLAIGGHGVSEVFLTENNIVVLECVKIGEDFYPIEDTEYYVRVN